MRTCLWCLHWVWWYTRCHLHHVIHRNRNRINSVITYIQLINSTLYCRISSHRNLSFSSLVKFQSNISFTCPPSATEKLLLELFKLAGTTGRTGVTDGCWPGITVKYFPKRPRNDISLPNLITVYSHSSEVGCWLFGIYWDWGLLNVKGIEVDTKLSLRCFWAVGKKLLVPSRLLLVSGNEFLRCLRRIVIYNEEVNSVFTRG